MVRVSRACVEAAKYLHLLRAPLTELPQVPRSPWGVNAPSEPQRGVPSLQKGGGAECIPRPAVTLGRREARGAAARDGALCNARFSLLTPPLHSDVPSTRLWRIVRCRESG